MSGRVVVRPATARSGDRRTPPRGFGARRRPAARAAVAALAASGIVAGCAPTPAPPATQPSGRASTTAAPQTLLTIANRVTPELVAQRGRAGLPDCRPPATASGPVANGLPNVQLPCLGSDKSVNLADLRGEPLVVNLWAQWCGPCRVEAPYLAEFARRASGKVRVIGVDYTDPAPDKAIEFARTAGWRYEQLVDADGALRGRMAVPGIPVTLLVAPDGRVVYRETGGLTSLDALTAAVQQHLGVSV